jgi:ATP-dependent Lon protease
MPPGVVMGLAWTSLGGKTLFVETQGRVPTAVAPKELTGPKGATASEEAEVPGKEGPVPPRRVPGGGARIQVTGKVGKVMNESSEIALTYARMFMREVKPQNGFLEEAAMHMNMPEGAAPKDGPSAGVTMTTSFLSLALNKPVKDDLGMAGELTLTGKVLRVRGIKEKTIAARRENVGTIVLPMSNHADYMELKPHLRAGLTAHFVDHYDDVYRIAFGETDAPMPTESRGSEVKTVITPLEEMAMPPPMGSTGSSCQVPMSAKAKGGES